jgi:hypothetical protein
VDKNEYKVKSEQMLELMERGAFNKAAKLADSIEWGKVRNISMLSSVSEIYERNNELEKSYQILNIAYQRSDGSRKIIYRLCSLALKTGNLDEALDFYDDFMEIAPKDPNQYILRYKILRARKAPVKDQIEALENYKQEEYIEEWAYELAKLYEEAGMTAECITECDDIILWFSEGKYVYQAMDLKRKYKPLSSVQQEKYNRRYEGFQIGTGSLEGVIETVVGKRQEEQIESTYIQEPRELPKEQELSEPLAQVSIPLKNEEELGEKIGHTMDLGDALAGLLHEDKPNYVEEEEYVINTSSMEEAIGAIEAITDLPLAQSYGMSDSKLDDHDETTGLSIEDILQSMSDASLDPDIQRMIDEIEGNESLSSSGSDLLAKDTVQKREEDPAPKVEPIEKEQDDFVHNPSVLTESLRLSKEDKQEDISTLINEVGFHEEFEEEIIELSKEDIVEEVKIEVSNQDEENTLFEKEEELLLEEAEDLEESLFENSANSASKFIQEEFQLQDTYLEEEDERFVKEKKKRKKPEKKDGLTRSTAPLSRKETAKLHATGKTAPIPTGEISNAISMEDTGFVVQGRYDLESQSGKGIRAGLTEEQKKLFSYFVPVRGMSEQLVEVLEQDKSTNRGGTSRTGNLLIIGQRGSGKTVLAVDLVKAIQKQRNVRQGKVAILTGEALNKKKIQDIIGKLHGGALIIEKAGKLNEKTIARLNKALEQETGELLVILEEQRKPLDRMLSMNNEFKRKFTFRLEVPVFINDELVTFGQTYAQENGYRIDEMGILALYSKIDAKQREDHAVTVAEVKMMMDAAIDSSQKASAGKLVKRIIGKNTDEADRVILSEKDFTE